MSRKLIPILFSTPMVQAILAGRKTQTRRVVKPQPPIEMCHVEPFDNGFEFYDSHIDSDSNAVWPVNGKGLKCPYGQPGDILWVRETWRKHSMIPGRYIHKADSGEMVKAIYKWKPSIHMPREACRLFLRIKSVRVERLQDITERDAKAEGVELLQPRHLYRNYKPNTWPQDGFSNPVSSFESLWRKINGGESWEANPWVWVIEFERITKEEALS